MGNDGSGEMGLNCPSSEMNTSAMSEKVVAGLAMSSGSAFFSSGWDPIVSLSRSENFGTSSVAAHGVFVNQLYPDPNVAEMVQKIPVFGGGNYSEMANPFGMPASMASVPSQDYCQMPERTLTASPNGKRKWVSTPSLSSSPNKMGLSGETSEPKESDEKKRKTEYNSDPDQFTKQSGKQVKDDSQSGEASKGNYIHVRARRGQATNSHSLAERVRREKISERMRMLQELVPGCNKITGKAVMLDEIINYVQSLQQQVEFLSMKLATVNPELNFDIDRIISKDILHLRGGVAPLLGLSPRTSSHPYAPSIHMGAPPAISNAPAYHPLPQGMWDGEMQGLFHMGFDSNQAIANLGPDGGSKPEA